MAYYTGMVTMVLGAVLRNFMRFVGFGLNTYRFWARVVDHNHNLCLGKGYTQYGFEMDTDFM